MRTLFRVFTASFAAALIFAIGFNSAFAVDRPNPPQKLSVEVKQSEDGAGEIHLSWRAPETGPRPDYFYLYMGPAQNSDPNTFELLQRIEAKDNQDQYKYAMKVDGPGAWTFFAVSVIMENGQMYESKPSNYVVAEIKGQNDKDFIRIVSKPPLYAKPNGEWFYRLQVEQSLRCPYEVEFEGPDGMTFEDGVFRWKAPAEGVFKMHIKVWMTCKESATDVQSFEIRVGENNNGDYVRIMSEPVRFVDPGDKYFYQVKAMSNVKCPILFMLLDEHPEGMKINRKTGEITWAPEREGVYGVVVKAYLECSEDVFAIQKFEIFVGKQNVELCAHIVGHVYFENGDNIPREAIVKAWSLDKNNWGPPFYHAKVAEDGSFDIAVPQGGYALQVEGSNFKPVWYENASNIADAMPFKIECGQKFEARFVIETLPEPDMIPVSGRATYANGDPALAIVEFLPLKLLAGGKDFDPRDLRNFVTKTDAEGYYRIELPNNIDFVAHAIAFEHKPLLDVWYNQVPSPFEADIITLDGPRKGINFIFESPRVFENGFTGQVKDIDGTPVLSTVVATLVEPADDQNTPPYRFVKATKTDEEGYFRFENLIPGEYVLLSIPFDRVYVPGYYKLNDVAVLNWREADGIGVGEAMIQMIFEITHELREAIPGAIELDGIVQVETGAFKANDAPQADGEPIGGALVYALDENGDIRDIVVSDELGRFNLEDLAAGEGVLVADKVGYHEFRLPLELELDRSESGYEIPLRPDELTSVENESEIEILTFPSPASQIATVRFEGDGSEATIEIVDASGNTVSLESVLTVVGTNDYEIDAKSFASGAHYVKISVGGKILTAKLIIAR